MRRSNQFWLIILLSVPAFIWSIPTLWMLSLSLQPNDVLARTTSSTGLGLIPLPFTLENYWAPVSYTHLTLPTKA